MAKWKEYGGDRQIVSQRLRQLADAVAQSDSVNIEFEVEHEIAPETPITMDSLQTYELTGQTNVSIRLTFWKWRTNDQNKP